MNPRKPQVPDIEPRWPVMLAIFTLLVLLAVLPGHLRVYNRGVPLAFALVAVAPMVAVARAADRERWLPIERGVMLLVFLLTEGGSLLMLTRLIDFIVNHSSGISGEVLLTSSIGVWFTNVFAFSFLYWALDRGGPGPRWAGSEECPDWTFPQEGASPGVVPEGWRPRYVDYLFLSYSTATAFSTTDVPPMTGRAKLLMMVESSVSLTVIAIVGARAINILGG